MKKNTHTDNIHRLSGNLTITRFMMLKNIPKKVVINSKSLVNSV